MVLSLEGLHEGLFRRAFGLRRASTVQRGESALSSKEGPSRAVRCCPGLAISTENRSAGYFDRKSVELSFVEVGLYQTIRALYHGDRSARPSASVGRGS